MFYLLIARLPATANAVILLVLAVLVFVPIRYLYPSRTPVLMWPTNILGAIWGVLMLVMLVEVPGDPAALCSWRRSFSLSTTWWCRWCFTCVGPAKLSSRAREAAAVVSGEFGAVILAGGLV